MRYSFALQTTCASLLLLPSKVLAQIYGGPGLEAGADAARQVEGVNEGNLRQQLANLVNTALTYVALIAVVVIIIAGFFLIFSFGDDSRKDTARKIIIYTAIGILVILLAKVIVAFFIALPQ